MTYRTGATRLVVYRTDEPGHNRQRRGLDMGGDVDAIVKALEAKRAKFEHYPDIGKLRGNIHHAGGMKLVWLKDPDDNILHLNSM